MNQILLISPQYVKDFSTYDLNVDDRLLNASIRHSQNYILSIVGTGLMNDLLSKVSTGTISGNNQTLLVNYVQPALASYVLYEASYAIMFKFTNKSIETQKSETTTPISDSQFEKLQAKLLDKAQVEATKLNDYLIANSTLFPLYENPGTAYDTVFPKRVNEFSYGIYTPKRNRNRYRGYDYPEDQHPIL